MPVCVCVCAYVCMRVQIAKAPSKFSGATVSTCGVVLGGAACSGISRCLGRISHIQSPRSVCCSRCYVLARGLQAPFEVSGQQSQT